MSLKRYFLALFLAATVLVTSMPSSGAGVSMMMMASAAYTPANLSGLTSWLEADTQAYTDLGTTLCVTDGDLVRQWNDLKGANPFIQNSSGTRPVYKTNLSNSKPGLRFNHATQIYLNSSTVQNNKPVSFGCVMRATNASTYFIWAGQSANGFAFVAGTTAGFQKEYAVQQSDTTSLTANTFYILIVTYDSSGNYAFTVNGAPGASGTNNQTLSTSGLRIGAANDTGNAFGGDILAIASANVVWRSDEIKRLTAYWNAKYAIY